MDSIRQYILTVIVAACIASIALSVTGKSGMSKTIIKLLCGIFLSVTVISPLAKIQLKNISSYLSELNTDASNIVNDAQFDIDNIKRQRISEGIQAYILDEAGKIGLDIDVAVDYTDDHSLVPDIVRISGAISPYKMTVLQKCISEDLGIPEEQQHWN